MTLVRREPARELHSLQQEMNRLFGSVFDAPAAPVAAAQRQWIPAMDLVETDGHYVLRADLPGLGEDAVKFEREENVLTISGERQRRHRVAIGLGGRGDTVEGMESALTAAA